MYFCTHAEVAEASAGIQSIKAILPVCVKPVHVETTVAETWHVSEE
jgi:hypothetical protein